MHNSDDMKEHDNQPATKGDLNRLTERFATKTDLERFATKTDLERFATKIDLERFATKDDLKETRRTLAIEIVKTQADVREIKETMATKNDVERILVAVEAFAGKAQVYDRAAVLHGHALTEAEVTLRDHEKRLRAIETRET